MVGDRREVEEVKAGLKDRILDLCQAMLPAGRRENRFWVAHNPATSDEAKDPALKIALDRDVGAWIDWRSGDKGDVVGLVAHCLATDFKGAMDWSREWLGLTRMSTRERADFSARNEQRRVDAQREAENKAAERRKAVRRLWDSAAPIVEDSAAALLAHRYFALGRGVPLADVAQWDRETFRVAPALEWWKGARWSSEGGRRQKVAPGPEFPAIVSAFRSATGLVTGVHCTFLDPVQPAKAPVKSPKLMFGEAMGSVIRIAHGPEGLPPETATIPAPLILCEGIEDGLSLAIAVPDARVWAGGSLIGMGAAPVWLPCVSMVFVAADNDWQSRTALEQFDQVLAKLSEHDKPVEVMRSAVGKDFNDGYVPQQGK
ncbi:hypothetical protein GTW51_10120 [Aurantimonas aggregata]|uniref:Uncharacterized protein n=1 Tax=Aurantimonas aggregata TaxID=2047720 RepID=A0A6L9MGY3_9HYPH|nr:toprim domain-containing protein [Aurantimonas aggregata]NDV87057.1 hypothetical protein [Aurantimonas aggregata]